MYVLRLLSRESLGQLKEFVHSKEFFNIPVDFLNRKMLYFGSIFKQISVLRSHLSQNTCLLNSSLRPH